MSRKLLSVLLFSTLLLLGACSTTNKSTEVRTNTPASTSESSTKPSKMTIFFIKAEDFNITTIPYYNRGTIDHLTAKDVEQYKSGHMVTLGDPVEVVRSKASNLVPAEYTDNSLIKSDNVKLTSKDANQALVKINVGKGLSYDITLSSPKDSGGIYVITKIDIITTLQ